MTKKQDVSKAAQLMGAKGGRKTAQQMTPEQKSERARIAAQKRWAGKSPKKRKIDS